MSDDIIPGAAEPADVAVQPDGNGKVKQQTAILTFLGLTLMFFALGLVAIGVVSMFRPAADPQAVNATRETMGQLVIFILGVFAALVAPNAAAAIRK